jgi:hypothetical protein
MKVFSLRLLFALFLLICILPTPVNADTQGNDIVDIIIFPDTASVNLGPGRKFKVAFSSVRKNGKQSNPNGLAGRKNYWQYDIKVEGGTFDDGYVIIDSNPRSIKNHEIIIEASPKNKPEPKKVCRIKLNYKGVTILNFDGRTGDDPRDRGKMIIPVITASEGRPGLPGEAGKDLIIWVWMHHDTLLNATLLKGEITEKLNPGVKTYFIINTKGGSLRISAKGGKGGQGGAGAEGADGRDRSDKPGRSGGDGGNGGEGGDGGDGGKGGSITLHFDVAADPFFDLIYLDNSGGSGGFGGNGGRGGKGGKGGAGASYGSDGSSGSSGKGGMLGPDGPGPEITFENIQPAW